MMTKMNRSIAFIGAVIGLVSCNGLWLDTYWRSGNYVLTAVDTRTQMSLGIDQENGTAIGVVGPTIYSIGADDRYIVVKQHPSTNPAGTIDRSITNYYAVVRLDGPSHDKAGQGTQGPLSNEDYEKLAVSLLLPPFTKTFDDLK